MEGLGNDYLYVSCFTERVADPSALARRISDRHRGVGADGLVLIGPSTCADFSMRIFNADGSESEMCGNAARCVGRYVYERGLWNRDSLTLETGGRVRAMRLRLAGGRVASVQVDMGKPLFRPEEIPARLPGEEVRGLPLPCGEETWPVHCLSMGNPHCVLFVEDVDTAPVERLGPAIEHHPAFPNRINVEFAQVVSRDQIYLRVWERGAGETQACGTGACAAFAAALRAGLADSSVTVTLPGGPLALSLTPEGQILQEGPAVFVFDGDWPDDWDQ